MKFSFFYPLIAVFILISSCKNSTEQEDGNTLTNGQLKQNNCFIYLDTIQIEQFLQQYPANESYRKNLESFYKKRNYELVWINNSGINEYASNFINLLNQEGNKNKKDSLFYNDELHTLHHLLSENPNKCSGDSRAGKLELLLTVNFFDYAKRNWGGINNEEANKMSWFIDRKKLNYENLLDTILKSNADSIYSFEPLYRQYSLLKRYLQKYIGIEKSGEWPTWNDSIKELKKGDTSVVIVSVKKRLYLLKDLSSNDNTNIFEDSLVEAVKKFQKRNGLKEDGVIAGKTAVVMSTPIHELIQQILINMERCKWVPVEQKGDYIAVNIPDFKMYVYDNDSLEWSCNVVVGKSSVTHNTVIFNDDLKYIVFSPYWNIPKNILTKETLPEIKKDETYLESHNMEIIDRKGKSVPTSSIDWEQYTEHFPYIIRQKPGKNNALGLVKFIFPNSYDIYMHDTPEKSLFDEPTRMFSHGCIRIEEPFKLAKFLLRDDSIYTDEKITALMLGGKETFVKLKKKVPVFIAYFTSWVDREGKLNSREDVYHHDEKMKQLLFVN